MKTAGMFVVISTISMLLLFQIAIILAVLMPELYAPIAGLDVHDEEPELFKSHDADLKNNQINNNGGDSTGVEPVWDDTISVRERTIAMLQDSMRSIERKLSREKQNNDNLSQQIKLLKSQLDDRSSNEIEALVKMLESMSPEDAVKILRTTTDKEVREALLIVNRRQAARIMALLEPDRAARIMKFTVEGSD